jgi:iron complex transport system substrate-binding protein
MKLTDLRRRLAILLAVGLAILAHPVTASEMVISHPQGQTRLAATPKTVLVFDLSVLDTLDALGVPVAGVPRALIPDYLSKYRGDAYAKIGSLFEPDLEAVHAARPDLILVAARSSPRYGELARIAPTIDLTVQPERFLEQSRQNIETLGRIFDKQAEAAALLARIDGGVARLRERAASAGTGLFIMVSGGRLTAYGPGSRFGWLHNQLGIRPAVTDMQAANHGQAISFEFIARTDPEWLFVLDRDTAIGQAGAAGRQVLDNELVAATRAARSGRILYVDPAKWYIASSGATALISIIEDLAAAVEAGRSR